MHGRAKETLGPPRLHASSPGALASSALGTVTPAQPCIISSRTLGARTE